MDRTTEEDDGHIGEAMGEEGDERGRGAVGWVALGGAGVGGLRPNDPQSGSPGEARDGRSMTGWRVS